MFDIRISFLSVCSKLPVSAEAYLFLWDYVIQGFEPTLPWKEVKVKWSFPFSSVLNIYLYLVHVHTTNKWREERKEKCSLRLGNGAVSNIIYYYYYRVQRAHVMLYEMGWDRMEWYNFSVLVLYVYLFFFFFFLLSELSFLSLGPVTHYHYLYSCYFS